MGSLSLEKISLSHVRSVILVASGKGGVGKSTVAKHLAVTMQRQGRRVGILDADIYGPSVPFLMGVETSPLMENGKLIPHETHGIQSMSIGYLMNKSPLIWRGPMVQTAVKQLFKDVAWRELDVLIVDMPPGTGDIHLTISQSIPVTGAIIVSTPSMISWNDAFKCLQAFRNLEVPLLGIIENMSFLDCPQCDHVILPHKTFLQEKALEQAVSYLGCVPFVPEWMENIWSDEEIEKYYGPIMNFL